MAGLGPNAEYSTPTFVRTPGGCHDGDFESETGGGQHMIKYEVIIYWSAEDEAFVAEGPELPGCAAHGDSQESALANVQDAIRLWIDTQGVR